MKGWGPKSSACPSKANETKLLCGMSGDIAGTSRGHPKGLRKRGFGEIFPQTTLKTTLRIWIFLVLFLGPKVAILG